MWGGGGKERLRGGVLGQKMVVGEVGKKPKHGEKRGFKKGRRNGFQPTRGEKRVKDRVGRAPRKRIGEGKVKSRTPDPQKMGTAGAGNKQPLPKP